MPPLLRTLAAGLTLTLAACTEPAAPLQYPPGQLPPGQLAPGPGLYPQQGYPQQGYPQQGYPQQGYPQQGYAPPVYPTPPMIPPGPPVMSDPVNDADIPWLRAAATSVLGELVAALPPASQARVAGIPFVPDSTPGDINAYAACKRGNEALMSITDSLLQIEAYVAQFRATDEIFGTQKLDLYLRYLAEAQKNKQVAPPPGLIEQAQHTDYRKVVRERQILEEQMAFVLGHELAHHHLGHTGCANGQTGQRQPGSLGDLIRLGTRLGEVVVPGINQPNESSADDAGIWTVLTAGARRQGYRWTEMGALLTLDFFSKLEAATQRGGPEMPIDGLFRSHPQPASRMKPVQDAAARWRASGGTAPWRAVALP